MPSSAASRYDLPDKNAIHYAAALRTIGFKVRCKVETVMTSTGKTTVRWFATSAPADVRDLVKGKSLKPQHRQRQLMFRLCMDALAIRSRLDVWLRSGCDYYELSGAVSADDKDRPHTLIPGSLLDFAAACIAVGHTPRGRPGNHNGPVPALLLTSIAGTTIPQLGAIEKSLHDRHVRRGVAAVITLPGHPPEEHPWLYARESLYHLAECQDEQCRAGLNPTGLFAGKDGRTGLVSDSLLRRDDRAARNLELHLSGQL